MEEKTIHRFDLIREYYNLSVNELEKKLGMSNGSFAKALRSGASVKDDNIRALLEVFPKVSLRYVVMGDGEIEGVDEDDPDKLIEYMVLNHERFMKDSLLYREKMSNLVKDEFIKRYGGILGDSAEG